MKSALKVALAVVMMAAFVVSPLSACGASRIAVAADPMDDHSCCPKDQPPPPPSNDCGKLGCGCLLALSIPEAVDGSAPVEFDANVDAPSEVALVPATVVMPPLPLAETGPQPLFVTFHQILV